MHDMVMKVDTSHGLFVTLYNRCTLHLNYGPIALFVVHCFIPNWVALSAKVCIIIKSKSQYYVHD